MVTDEASFKRYLVREFFWELEQHLPRPSSFAGVQQEAVEVLAFRGYDDLRVRVEDDVFDIHLSWRKDVAPEIRKIADFSPGESA
jgi:hypothetical protein